MTTATKFITAYGKKKRVAIHTGDEGGAKQSFKEECDINNILSRYVKTGVLEHVQKHEPNYGFATSMDYHEAQNIIATANSMFEELPSKIRNRFDNNPAAFLDFVHDEKNVNEMRELGILPPEEPSDERQAGHDDNRHVQPTSDPKTTEKEGAPENPEAGKAGTP